MDFERVQSALLPLDIVPTGESFRIDKTVQNSLLLSAPSTLIAEHIHPSFIRASALDLQKIRASGVQSYHQLSLVIEKSQAGSLGESAENLQGVTQGSNASHGCDLIYYVEFLLPSPFVNLPSSLQLVLPPAQQRLEHTVRNLQHLSLRTNMAETEGAAVPQAAKGSWSSFLRVRECRRFDWIQETRILTLV
nr:hypothetical protein CFP56_21686 [Quercus suber]